MIDIFHKCTLIQKELNSYVPSLLDDFRIVLRTNENLYIYIKTELEDTKKELSDKVLEIYPNAEIEFLQDEDINNEIFYRQIFDFKDKINLGKGRRRFDSLFKGPNSIKIGEGICPVATFYSYKGGMGRSTTLAALAMHLSLIERKNVVIIDCDFEAPGFTNFFLKHSSEENNRQGLIEYLIDKETGLATKDSLEKYSWQVESKYVGAGSIRVVPAGNLGQNDTEDVLQTDLHHYIEGLSRIDFTNYEYISSQFHELLKDINASFHPDVVLIDSRTGLSDVMGIAALNISKFVFGFFRNDAQSKPGLRFFLEKMIERKNVEPYLINSILPQSISLKKKIFETFKEEIKAIIENINEDSGLDFLCFPISRNENLEVLGTSSEDPDDLVNLIKEKDIKEYKELFEHFSNQLENLAKMTTQESQTPLVVNTDTIVTERTKEDMPAKEDRDEGNNHNNDDEKLRLKENILTRTLDKLKATSLYADATNFSVEDEYKKNQFFYRNCMNDLFNIDKPIVLGSKGTGKSYIHKALNVKIIVDDLKSRASKLDNYTFLTSIDKTTRIVKIDKKVESPEKRYASKFWLIYTWQVLVAEIKKNFQGFTLKKGLFKFDIMDDNSTLVLFDELIYNELYVQEIEKEIIRFDEYLISQGNGKKEYLIILYDQLDEIISPEFWNYWIPSLIDFWRFKRYKRIFGKLFIRRDLFRRLVGINNINDLENQAIDIEWTREEIFSYFFKLVFSDRVADDFWRTMELYDDIDLAFIEKNKPKYSDNQFPLKEHLLRPLVITFFGQFVDVNNTTRMGESYDWFYKNLKNADETISLRPFIDLISSAIKLRLNHKDKSETPKPILFQRYYTNDMVRKMAVDRHFNDLIRTEKGTMPIQYVFEYFDNCNSKYKYMTLKKTEFEEVLKETINEKKEKQDMKNQTVDSLKELMITNGIVRKINHGKGDQYQFSYLYKYRLGLKGS